MLEMLLYLNLFLHAVLTHFIAIWVFRIHGLGPSDLPFVWWAWVSNCFFWWSCRKASLFNILHMNYNLMLYIGTSIRYLCIYLFFFKSYEFCFLWQLLLQIRHRISRFIPHPSPTRWAGIRDIWCHAGATETGPDKVSDNMWHLLHTYSILNDFICWYFVFKHKI